MAFRKVFDSQTDGVYLINQSDKKRYPVGFEYRIAGIIYTVREDVTKDAGSEMRRVITSDGSTEILTLETIDADLKDVEAQIINSGTGEKAIKVEPKVEQADEPNPEEKEAIVKKIAENKKKKEEEKGDYDGLDW